MRFTSYWQATAPRFSTAARGGVSGRYDVAVIGAGFTGLGAARRLAKDGRSVVVLAKQRFNLRERDLASLGATFVSFSAHTRMSGVDFPDGRSIRKGAADAVVEFVKSLDGMVPADLMAGLG